MRSVGPLLLAACLTMAGLCRAETKFPYSLAVPPGGVTLRSGPGATFYATDRLAAGVQVEIYREEADGWLAVRPPPGSFSLVERRQLKAGEEPGVAVVLAEDVLSCVGSRVEAVPTYVSQVRLRKDELVELLDKWDDEAAAKSGDGGWCRIAPPAGEFRWVQANELKRDASTRPDTTVRAEPPTEKRAAGTSGPTTTPKTSFEADGWRTRPADLAASPPRTTAPASPAADPVQPSPVPDAKQAAPTVDANPGWTAIPTTAKPGHASQVDTAKASPKAKPTTPVASQIRVPVDGEKLVGRRASESPAAPGTNQPPSAPATPAPLASAPLTPAPATPVPATPAAPDRWTSRTPPPRQSVEELEVDLAMMVAQDAQTWRLAELRQRVDANLLRFETTAERVQARRLLERIGEFEQLQSRMAQASPAAVQPSPLTASSPPAVAAAPGDPSAPADASASTAADVKYDGSGWLVPVHSVTGAAPPFALLDAQGEVLGYVSPTPGLNLQRYVRKQVGIFGLRGYVSTLNKPHVTAERVVDLDRHLR
ncbi:MAG: hypothetical protein MUE50_21900 [Pirellulaceae bacterium]|nr:hypothetical protein [Pirellulaceae bacterium]